MSGRQMFGSPGLGRLLIKRHTTSHRDFVFPGCCCFAYRCVIMGCMASRPACVHVAQERDSRDRPNIGPPVDDGIARGLSSLIKHAIQ